MSKVINFLHKKREKEVSDSKVFCVALAGQDMENLAYGSLYIFPTQEDRERYQDEVMSLVGDEPWRNRLALAGVPRSELKPPRILGLNREMIIQGRVEDFNSVNPPYELVFVMDFLSEVERRTGATRLAKDEYMELLEDER